MFMILKGGHMDAMSDGTGFLRHVRACNNARLPGERRALSIGGVCVGWVSPAVAAALADHPAIRWDGDGMTLSEPAALPRATQEIPFSRPCRMKSATMRK